MPEIIPETRFSRRLEKRERDLGLRDDQVVGPLFERWRKYVVPVYGESQYV